MKRVLVFAAHPDDEVLGPGATLARLRAEGAEVHVAIVTDGCSAQYPGRPELIEQKQRMAHRALDILGGGTLRFGGYPDMKLDMLPIIEINAFLEAVVTEVQPDVVFTHHYADLNRDHRIVSEASIVACRPHSSHRVQALLAYEILGTTSFGGMRNEFRPSLFYDVEQELEKKIGALKEYELELRSFPHPRSLDAVQAQARYYGALCGCTRAEAFEVMRETR